MTARDNAKHFPNDAVWVKHCETVAAYLEYVAKTGKEPTLSPEAEAQVERAMRRHERRDPEKYDRFTGSYMTEAEEFSS